jgi:hypothetical protein
MIRHPESVKCLHIHGWDLCRWCAACRRDWDQFEAEPGQDREAAFRRYCDVIVAYAVLEELESERIAVPTFVEIVERLRPLPSFEPSSNEPASPGRRFQPTVRGVSPIQSGLGPPMRSMG